VKRYEGEETELFNLDTILNTVVSFKLWFLYLREKTPYRFLGGSLDLTGGLEEMTKGKIFITITRFTNYAYGHHSSKLLLSTLKRNHKRPSNFGTGKLQ
jgi:hypothetical protein